MKTIKKHDDGIEWLRKLRLGIADRCGHDLASQSALYHQAAGKHSYKSLIGEAAIIKLAGQKLQKPRKRIA
jgi:hypothetical protein